MSMEQVFLQIHARASGLVLRRTSPAIRSVVEHAVLFGAVCTFCVVVVAHKTFVYKAFGDVSTSMIPGRIAKSTSSCLLHIPGFDRSVHVTNVFLRHARDYIQEESFVVDYTHASSWEATPNCESSFCQYADACVDEESTRASINEITNTSTWSSTGFYQDDVGRFSPGHKCDDLSLSSAVWTQNKQRDHLDCRLEEGRRRTNKILPSDEALFSYSQTRGYLLLPEPVRERHGIRSQNVVVSTGDAKCFSDSFLQSIIVNLIGPKTIVLNWFLALHGGDGYMSSNVGQYEAKQAEKLIDLRRFAAKPLFRPSTVDGRSVGCGFLFRSIRCSLRGVIRLSYFVLFKCCILLASLFLFFVTTTLVSFTLRETQEKMLSFTVLLQTHIRQGLPYAQLVFKHVVESLVFVPITVGILFFLIETFHGDRVLAFMVLSVVWMCEVFSVMGMRTRASMRFFPRVYFLYFSLFHAYYFSCPHGFAYMSLLATVLFLVHSMLFFWNRFELPALQRGIISQAVPRQNIFFDGRSSSGTESNAATSVHLHEDSANTAVTSRSSTSLSSSTINTSMTHEHQTAQRRISRQPSYGTSFPSSPSLGRVHSQGRLSRVTSDGSEMFIEGDDEDDDPYMTFMNGEVVMHRDIPTISPNPVFYQRNREGESISGSSTGVTRRQQQQQQRSSIHINSGETSALVGPATDAVAALFPSSGAAMGGTTIQRGPFGPQILYHSSNSLGDLLLAGASASTHRSSGTPRQCFFR